MFTDKTLQEVAEGKQRWEKELARAGREKAKKGRRFSTVSDLEIKAIYTPEDIKHLDFSKDIGYPGVFPFTRGCQPTMYRGKDWTFRMFSGMGSAEDTNKRWHHLLKEGEIGLSTAFDFPTLMGYDTIRPGPGVSAGNAGWPSRPKMAKPSAVTPAANMDPR